MIKISYLDVPFDFESIPAKNLFSRLEEEADQTTTTLTAIYSREGLPPYLTPAMAAWYKYYVQPTRTRLLNQIIDDLNSQAGRRGTAPFIAEIERDRIDLRKFEAMQTERDAF